MLDMLPEHVRVRALADSRDRERWLRARAPSIGASDAANFSKIESAPRYIAAKLHSPWTGNEYARHGHDREPHMLRAFNIEQNTMLFRSTATPRHVATPDGIKVRHDGGLILAQCKALDHDPMTRNGLPPRFMRQCWWEQYVMGAERTLFIWEIHRDFRPVSFEPESIWIDRDDEQIAKLVTIANLVLAGMDAGVRFTREMEGTSS